MRERWVRDWWLDYGPDLLMGLLLVALVAVLVLTTKVKSLQRQQFLDECVADGRKPYECLALYRSGEPSVVPVFIPIGAGR